MLQYLILLVYNIGFINYSFQQIYSEFGHRIRVHTQDCPDWIIESPYWTSASSKSQSVFAHLLPGESQNFLGIILCFQQVWEDYDSRYGYSVKNTTSGFVWSDNVDYDNVDDPSESLMCSRTTREQK
ncbi:hypothetical protein POM88_020032 [Heracleum sosnowskyi]|uniref:Uncharacterized protein n=1 Tax=Heracleum sosnowskyi TaxID=360622 RepID=A0AAD8IAM0_9APIA|nr:hypothetical protein POM88_020032 [Heracleum sosnowskyi]